jgi:hypothetical protein
MRNLLSGPAPGDPPGASGKPHQHQVSGWLTVSRLPGRLPSGLAFLDHLPVIRLAHLLQQLVQGHRFHDIIEGPQLHPLDP